MLQSSSRYIYLFVYQEIASAYFVVKPFIDITTAEETHEREQAREQRRRLVSRLVLSVLAVATLAGVGYWVILPNISKLRQKKDLQAAAAYAKQGDVRRAILSLEQMIQIYPDHREAKRQLANFYERVGQPRALTLWSDLVRVHPDEPANLLGLAGAALRMGQVTTARLALEELKTTGHDSYEYHQLAAGLATVDGDVVALEQHLAQQHRLKPDDAHVQLNLAIARLHHPDAHLAQAGRTALLELARRDRWRIRATIELFNDLVRRWPRPTAERGAAFDALARALMPVKGPRIDPSAQQDSVTRLFAFAIQQPDPTPEDVAALLGLMAMNGRAGAAFGWLDVLPAEVKDSPTVRTIAADAALRVGDLPRLRRLLLAGAWGEVAPDIIHRVLDLRVERAGSPPSGTAWADVVESSRASLAGLRALLKMAEAWDWPAEQVQVLNAVTRAFPGEAWAWRQRISYAFAHGDAREVAQLYQRWSRAQPGEPAVKIEAAIMSLLLQQSGAPTVGETTELLRQHPHHPGASVAQALALWRARRNAEALALLDGLPPAVFAETRFALVYGLVLAEADRARDSEIHLRRALATPLLPDEIHLVERAQARNRLRLASP